MASERGDGREATILHVDMDSFYASVEQLLDPSLRGRPVIVGGDGDRGVVASCSYEARVHGVHSAMPSVRAKRLCPHAVFVHGRFDTYADYSRRIHAIFRDVTPLVEGISLDEAFLDVAGARRLLGPADRIAHHVRHRIHEELGLSCGVGVATCKLLAKLASKAAKPRVTQRGVEPGPGVVVVAPGTELDFLHPLPVGALWGVGPATQARLARFGIETVGDLARTPLATLTTALGKGQGRHLHDLAWARDDRPVTPEQPAKSVGHEETYARDLHTHEALGREAVRMADAVAARLRKSGLAGRTVTIKVRFGDFRTITRAHTLPTATDTGAVIARVARDLLARVDPSAGVRLFGVTASNLTAGADRQLTLDDVAAGTGGQLELAGDEALTAAADAVERIRERFGPAAVGPATLVGEDGLRVKRQGDTQWGPSAPGPKGRTDR